MRALLLAFVAVAQIKVGDKIPSVTLHHGFPPTFVDLAERVAGRKVVLVGLPGAFTPT
jgi:2-Cys peroxiredoxin 5